MGETIRAQRLLELYCRLIQGERLTIRRMTEEYDINRRSAGRDLEFLKFQLPDLEYEEIASGERSWKLPQHARSINVRYTIRDILSLFMGRRLFDFLENTSLEASFNRVYGRIEAQIDRVKDLDDAAKISKKVYLVHEGPKKLPVKISDILDTCLTGLIHESKLLIRYRNNKGELKRYHIHPYTLTAYKRGLYLVGYVEEKTRPLVFRLENITSATWLRDQKFDYPKDYTPETFFENALFITIGEPEAVELRFTASTNRFIAIRQFHPSQETHILEDGRVQMRLTVPVNFEIVNWVLSFGEHVEVVKPDRLRAMVRDQLRAALAQYL